MHLKSPFRSNGTRSIKHPASTNFHDDQHVSSAKRLKRFASTDSAYLSDSSKESTGTPDVDGGVSSSYFDARPKDVVDDNGGNEDAHAAPSGSQTDLESALPPIKNDQEAIENYETSRAAADGSVSVLEQRLESGKWVKGRSSIYVDAFNLALETVLEDEKHLFDEPELAVFEHWRELPYETQYL